MIQIGPDEQGKLHEDGPQALIRIGRTEPEMRQERALVDTGAKYCAVDPEFAAELGLRKVDRRHPLTDGMGTRVVGMYMAQMAISGLGSQPRLRLLSEYPLPGRPYKVLLGRDVLAELSMLYNGLTGRVELRIARLPS